MSTLNEQEYWDLCQRLANQQYSDEEDYYEMDPSIIPDSVWMPSEPSAKENILPDYNGVIDFTNAKGSQILNKIHKCRNFQVGSFLIKITKYKGEPGGIKLDLIIYEEDKKKKDKSKQFNIVNKLDVSKDDRFKTRDWKSYFNSMKMGTNIPLEKITEIMRWLQAIQKMRVYL